MKSLKTCLSRKHKKETKREVEKVLEDLLKRFFADELYLDTTQKNGFQFFYWILVAKNTTNTTPPKIEILFFAPTTPLESSSFFD
jgi:hypothetical protein